MIIDLNSFIDEKAIDETLAAEAIDLELENARIASPVTVQAVVRKSDGKAELTGRLTGEITIDCDRCLETVHRRKDIALDLEFVGPGESSTEASQELLASELKVDELSGSELDLAAIAKEQILLDLPQQFFCSPDCKGLCEKCGTNLNLNYCDCDDNEIDPRWAALQNLN